MSELKAPARAAAQYDGDFYLWTQEQGRSLRARGTDAIDWDNVAEEIESLGRSDKRAIGSDLKFVLEHLIKWQHQSERRTQSWRDSIDEHRDRISVIVADSPSLRSVPDEQLAGQYEKARRKVLRDTQLPAQAIPETCPLTIDQVLDPDFRPDAPDV